jgi:hypothetical protein
MHVEEKSKRFGNGEGRMIRSVTGREVELACAAFD